MRKLAILLALAAAAASAAAALFVLQREVPAVRRALEHLPFVPPASRVPAAPADAGHVFFDCRFDGPGSLEGWEEKAFSGKTEYATEESPEGGTALRVRSRQACSALYREIDAPIGRAPVLEWSWRAAAFPGPAEGRRLDAREYNDFAGRVYVVFRGRSIMSSDIIEYAWDQSLPEGTFSDSPYSKRVKMLVVRSGPPPEGAPWAEERRDVRADYERLFGKPPAEDIRAVAFMSDSDNTRGESELWIRHIALTLTAAGKEPGPEPGSNITVKRRAP